MGTSEARDGTVAVGQSASRPTPSTIFAGILAAFNVSLALSPGFEVIYLLFVGAIGAASIMARYVHPAWERSLAIGAAIISLSAAIFAIISAIILYPFIGNSLFSFLSVNAVHILYLIASVTSLAASFRWK